MVFVWRFLKKNNRATGVGVTSFGYPHRRRQFFYVLWTSSASGTDFPAAQRVRAVANELAQREGFHRSEYFNYKNT